MIALGLPPLAGWLILGMALVGVEMLVAPGSYLLWIGLAAFAMAALSWLVPLTAGTELLLFGALSLGAALVGIKVYGSRKHSEASTGLDDPAAELVGRELQLASAIVDGVGQARFGDSIWRVVGPDLPAGTLVVVTGLDGASLEVRPKAE